MNNCLSLIFDDYDDLLEKALFQLSLYEKNATQDNDTDLLSVLSELRAKRDQKERLHDALQKTYSSEALTLTLLKEADRALNYVRNTRFNGNHYDYTYDLVSDIGRHLSGNPITHFKPTVEMPETVR